MTSPDNKHLEGEAAAARHRGHDHAAGPAQEQGLHRRVGVGRRNRLGQGVEHGRDDGVAAAATSAINGLFGGSTPSTTSSSRRS